MPHPQGVRRRAHSEALSVIRPTHCGYHPHLPTPSRLSELFTAGIYHDRFGSTCANDRYLRIDVKT